MRQLEWTDEQKLARARLNANVCMLATIVYLKQKGLPVEEWAKSVGEQLVSSWDGQKGGSALNIARDAASNPISLGGVLVSFEGDNKQATVVFDYAPSKELSNLFSVPIEDVETFFSTAYQVIFAYLGITFSLQRDGERWTLKFSY